MKQIELSTGTLLVVDPDKNVTYGHRFDSYELLGHPSEITGEVWGKVVEKIVEKESYIGGLSRTFHKDYVTKLYKYWGAPLSGLSLCAAHGIKETDVLLFKSNPATADKQQ